MLIMTTTLTATSMSTAEQRLRLMQLASSNLPVGGYSWSQGLEWAVEAGWVPDVAAFEREGDGLLLHGGGGVVAHLCDGGEGGLGQAEVLKRRTQSASPSVAELDGGRPGSVRIVCGAEESCADHLHL